MSVAATVSAVVTTPPLSTAADPTHETGPIFRVAHSASSAMATAVDIPKNLRGRWWTFLAIGANVDFGVLCADPITKQTPSAPTLTYGALCATGTGSTAAASETALDGVEKQVFVPTKARRIVYVSSSAPSAPASFKASLSSDQTGSQVA